MPNSKFQMIIVTDVDPVLSRQLIIDIFKTPISIAGRSRQTGSTTFRWSAASSLQNSVLKLSSFELPFHHTIQLKKHIAKSQTCFSVSISFSRTSIHYLTAIEIDVMKSNTIAAIISLSRLAGTCQN